MNDRLDDALLAVELLIGRENCGQLALNTCVGRQRLHGLVIGNYFFEHIDHALTIEADSQNTRSAGFKICGAADRAGHMKGELLFHIAKHRKHHWLAGSETSAIPLNRLCSNRFSRARKGRPGDIPLILDSYSRALARD